MCENLQFFLIVLSCPITPHICLISFITKQQIHGFNSVGNSFHRLTITPEQATFRLASGLSLPSKSALSDRYANWSCSYMSMDFSPWGLAFLCWERTSDIDTAIYMLGTHTHTCCGSPGNWIQSPNLSGHNGNALHCHPLPPHFPTVSVLGWPHEGGKVLHPW